MFLRIDFYVQSERIFEFSDVHEPTVKCMEAWEPFMGTLDGSVSEDILTTGTKAVEYVFLKLKLHIPLTLRPRRLTL